jgi:pyruvate dehydrogenase (quinone)
MNRPTLTDQVIEILRQAGVARVYGAAGDSLNPVVDAIRRTEGIEWVHVRNEEAGAFATAAEAQPTGRLAVWNGSRKPGNTHLIQKIYDAHRSGAPVLAIASHITAAEVRGFVLARTKIVLEGGGGGRLDLARANVRPIPRPAHVDAAMSPEHG